jgi:hypothetical protein
MLFSTFIGNRCTRYGIEKQPIAIEEFREKYDKCIDPCGLFVDEVDPYLGASSDGEVKMGPFYLKKTKMASISGISGSAAILKIFHLNLE